MYSDSRVSIAEAGFSYPATKMIKANGWLVGASGDGGDCSRFLEWARKGLKEKDEPKWKSPPPSEDFIIGLIMKEDGLYLWTWGSPEPERINSDTFAIGSGGKAARAALLMGATALQAVEIACEVDNVFSGLPIQTLSLKD